MRRFVIGFGLIALAVTGTAVGWRRRRPAVTDGDTDGDCGCD